MNNKYGNFFIKQWMDGLYSMDTFNKMKQNQIHTSSIKSLTYYLSVILIKLQKFMVEWISKHSKDKENKMESIGKMKMKFRSIRVKRHLVKTKCV